MTTVDIITTLNKTFREHRRYSGDGLPSPPSGAPLPVGDPSSGVHNPAKSDIRGAFTDVQAVLQTAVDAAETAEGNAEAAQAAAEAALAQTEAAAAQALVDIDAAEDAAVAFLGDLVSDAVSASNVPIISTRSALEILNIPLGLNAIQTNGYSQVGDGGGALYKRVLTEPATNGKVQSGDGAWWQLSEVSPNVLQYGADRTGASESRDAFAALSDDVGDWQEIYIPDGVYKLDLSDLTAQRTWSLGSDVIFVGAHTSLPGRSIRLGNGTALGTGGSIFGAQEDWFEGQFFALNGGRTSTAGAELVALSHWGAIGIAGVSRTSDSLTGPGGMSSIGVFAGAINDNVVDVQTAYAIYGDAIRMSGTGATHFLEGVVAPKSPDISHGAAWAAMNSRGERYPSDLCG